MSKVFVVRICARQAADLDGSGRIEEIGTMAMCEKHFAIARRVESRRSALGDNSERWLDLPGADDCESGTACELPGCNVVKP